MKTVSRFASLFALILPLSFVILTTSCGDDEDEKIADPQTAKLSLNFEHHVKGQPLVLNAAEYTNAAGNIYNITTLKYYISNVILSNSQTGEMYKEANSYHLISFNENRTSFNMTGLPLKQYDRISFAIGVDSAANLSTAQPGDLNPNNDMAWNWKTGYKFINLEGNNLKPDPNDKHGITLHIGHNENYKTVTFPISNPVTFASEKEYNARFAVDVNALLEGPNIIDFNTTPNIMAGGNAAKVAENYSDGMFSLIELKQQ